MKNHKEMHSFIRGTTNAATSSLQREIHNGKILFGIFARKKYSLRICNEHPFCKDEVAALLCRE